MGRGVILAKFATRISLLLSVLFQLKKENYLSFPKETLVCENSRKKRSYR